MGKSRTRLGIAAGTALASLALALPAQAAQAVQGDSAEALTGKACTPSITVLQSLPGTADPQPWNHDTQVNGFGPLALSVGVSRKLPVYWLGTSVHRVPLPAGYTAGSVAAVNRFGLMVGTLTGPGLEPGAFSYRPGARAVRLLAGGGSAKDVNDQSRIVGDKRTQDGLVGVEWSGTAIRRELALPAQVRGLEAIGGINNAGEIVGNGYGATEDGGYDVALRWHADAAAPATELPPISPGDTYSRYTPADIDEKGHITGTYLFTREGYSHGVIWRPPYTNVTAAGLLADRMTGGFDDISPTTGVSVGTAAEEEAFPPEPVPLLQAQIWPGSGPVMALPHLAPMRWSAAYAVTDDDRVGGVSADTVGTPHPVIWNCALKQAYVPTPRT
ncbi:hypothetical protein MTF65_00435 [Streptomyces sp. APSN-46.1]|uniref:hypothetical protein n=1 Tax=Streptomyces sp. APSN-46.1 TaxID=2929049 RepID=UPI001FB265EB|nr:hypothetical protein [Streptomyces sp. APSN-46.1]MCJ1675850.1 hypothetical protein [Streptomyces sp. APSN-46.1]